MSVTYVGHSLIMRLPVFGSKPMGDSLQKIKNSPQFNVNLGIFVNRRAHIIKQMNKDAVSLMTLLSGSGY